MGDIMSSQNRRNGMRISVVIVLVLSFAGCVHPSTTVRTLDDRPLIGIQGAPAAAIIYVNGQDMGHASEYDGEDTALRIEPGTHLIEIRDSNRVYFEDRIYAGSGSTKTINLGGK